jgi:hypothetical protein
LSIVVVSFVSNAENSLTDVGEPRRPIGLRPLVQAASQNRRWLEAEVDR